MKYKIITFSFLIFFLSCKDKKTLDYQLSSKEILSSSKYDLLIKNIEDSIKVWGNNNLSYYALANKSANIKLDKILCINKEKNKLISCLLVQCTDNCVQDDIWFFYGAKIENKWYFFQGATIVLPREMYQSDIHTPLSFEKLHEIALKEVFSGYLMKKEPIVPFWKFWVEQEYEVDESWFDSHFDGPSWGHFMDAHSDLNLSKIRGDSLFDNQTDYLNYMYKRKALDIWN